jgi:cholesterol transport system auxiliary component
MSAVDPQRPTDLARRRALRQGLGLALLLPAAACTPFALSRRQPLTLHRLTPKTTFTDNLPDLGYRLMIEPPSAASGLNTARIALRPDPMGLDYFADAQWVEVVPIMVQVLLLESFDASGVFDVLSPESTGLRPDFVLRAFIREFQAEYDEGIARPPLVNVHLQVRLLRMPRRESVAVFTASEAVRAAGTPLDRVILAFDEALGRVQRRVVEWTVGQVVEVTRET